MNRDEAQQRIDVLRKELEHNNHCYYVVGQPVVTDAKYDQLFDELMELEKSFPEFATPYSPTQKVGGAVVKDLPFKRHDIPMLSLGKATTPEALTDFLDRPEFSHQPMLAMIKLDGFTVSIKYDNGIYQEALTRGDGEQGQVITHNIATVRSLPLQIPFKKKLEVRGECVISKADFERINSEGAYTSPRNLAAGTAKLSDSAETAKRRLDVIIFSCYAEDTEFAAESEALEFLKSMGFKVVDYKTFTDKSKLQEYCVGFQEHRESLPFIIDGMVIKADSMALRRSLGENTREPRWATAYKFPAQSAGTTLREVRWQVSRNGLLTPVAVFDEVVLADAKITNATLHNAQFASGFKIGSFIEVVRSGEVIPKVTGILKDNGGAEIPIPECCPECGAKVEFKAPFAMCTGSNCISQVIEQVIHFASKSGMDIRGLGDSIIEDLVKNGKIKNSADLYRLTAEDFVGLEGFGERKIANILGAIEGSKTPTLAKFLYALGIPYSGVNTTKNLARNFGNLQRVMQATYEELVSIDDIGEITAQGIERFFKDSRAIIEEFIAIGINPSEEVVVAAGDILKGKTFVITGTLSRPRDEVKALIEQNGGKVTGTISTKTDYLVAGADVGAGKSNKAASLGITVISETEFMDML